MRRIIGKIIFKKPNFCWPAELDCNLINIINIAKERMCAMRRGNWTHRHRKKKVNEQILTFDSAQPSTVQGKNILARGFCILIPLARFSICILIITPESLRQWKSSVLFPLQDLPYLRCISLSFMPLNVHFI